jgi:hypothetical protein
MRGHSYFYGWTGQLRMWAKSSNFVLECGFCYLASGWVGMLEHKEQEEKKVKGTSG